MEHLRGSFASMSLHGQKPRCAAVDVIFDGDGDTITDVLFDCTAWSLSSEIRLPVRHFKNGALVASSGEPWSVARTRLVSLLHACGARVVFVYGEKVKELLLDLPDVLCIVVNLETCCPGFNLTPKLAMTWFMSGP